MKCRKFMVHTVRSVWPFLDALWCFPLWGITTFSTMAGKVWKKPGLHWGHMLIAAKCLANFIFTGLLKSFSIFIPHLVELLRTSYATVGLVCGLPYSLGYLTGPLVSYTITKYSLRSVGMTGGILSGIGIIGVAFCSNALAFGICMSITGVGTVMVNLPIVAGINQHFPVKFGVANAFGIIGSPVGAFVLPIITEILLDVYHLRGAILILGAVCLNAVICGAVLKPPRTRAALKVKFRALQKSNWSDGDEMCSHEHNTFDESHDCVLRTTEQSDSDKTRISTRKGASKTYYLCNVINVIVIRNHPLVLFPLFSSFLLMVVWIGWTLFLIPHAVSLGIDQSQAVYLATFGGIGGVIGLLLSAVILHFKPRIGLKMAVISSFICSCVFFTEPIGDSYELLSSHAFFIGFFVNLQFSLTFVVIKDAIPEDEFELGIGLMNFAFGVGSVCGSSCSGLVYDMTQSYQLLFLSFGGIQILVFICHLGHILSNKHIKKRSGTAMEV